MYYTYMLYIVAFSLFFFKFLVFLLCLSHHSQQIWWLHLANKVSSNHLYINIMSFITQHVRSMVSIVLANKRQFPFVRTKISIKKLYRFYRLYIYIYGYNDTHPFLFSYSSCLSWCWTLTQEEQLWCPLMGETGRKSDKETGELQWSLLYLLNHFCIFHHAQLTYLPSPLLACLGHWRLKIFFFFINFDFSLH